jgi:hypothetical protein
MKIKPSVFKPGIPTALLAGIVWLPLTCAAIALSGQSFAGSGLAAGVDGTAGASGSAATAAAATDAPDTTLFADGTRAINESRWADAVKIFAQVSGQHGEHADGALYWKAYAEDKLGQSVPSEQTCAELRSGYPKSRWIDDCIALDIELHAKAGKPVQIEAGESDDVKLLALNAMMRQDEPRAMAEIQAILNGDSSERLKKEAEFILGHHYSDETYAQIVRISYVEGDVRIARGAETAKTDSATWEKAVADVPLETGFSLVTGTGRAEIEFENASTLYLGENSVLTFNDLHETAGVPYTEVALLSGTVSLHVHPYVAGERFILRTPTDDIISRYPDRTNARIGSFTDAMTITPLEGGVLHLPGVSADAIASGRTWTYRSGVLDDVQGTDDKAASSAWDKWVGDRVAARAAATSEVMEAAGLTAPIPGLAEMAGEGKFFDCAPYGTCWEPNGFASLDASQAASLRREQEGRRPSLVLAAYHPVALPWAQAQAETATGVGPINREFFPCTPGNLRYRVVTDPATGKETVIDVGLGHRVRYGWAVCHAGSWIRHKRHYVWVAGGKRRHQAPVRWVKDGHKVGFVPLHPYDVKGQHAINVKHEVFMVRGKDTLIAEPVKLDAKTPVEFLASPPKEFRVAELRPLERAEAPHMEAHPFVNPRETKSVEVSRASIPIHFDAKSQSFMMPSEVVRGGKTVTVFAPITNRSGSLQARADSYSGGSGFRGSSGSSGGSRNGGSSSSSGSSHSGGSGSSGGSSHSSGGGGSTGSSSSSSSSGGSSSSSGGSHH